LNLVVAFDSNIVPKLDFDHKKKLVVKIEKSLKIGKEIFGIEKGEFDFRSKEALENKDIKLALIHFPPRKMLPKEAKNIEYIDVSDLTHSLDDDAGSGGLLAKKTVIENDQFDAVDLHTKKLKSCSKVKLST
jgi:hypothetical protein